MAGDRVRLLAVPLRLCESAQQGEDKGAKGGDEDSAEKNLRK